MSEPLKLLALDATDLSVISAHVQDALLKVEDIDFSRLTGTLSLTLRRFAWELKASRRWILPRHERRHSVLTFKRVSALRSTGIDRSNPDQILSLLTLQYFPSAADDANGAVGRCELVFADGGALAFECDGIEAVLTDTGAAWAVERKPRHDGSYDADTGHDAELG